MAKKQPFLSNQIHQTTPKSQRIFGSFVYWITIFVAVGALIVPIFILANPSNNILNPNLLFQAIFAGADPVEIWEYSMYDTFPGGHFYLRHLTMVDSWAMLLIGISCAFGLFGLVPAVIYQILKEKDWFCIVLGIAIIALIIFSVMGIVSIQT